MNITFAFYMFKRNISNLLDKTLSLFPAVILIGARQCGKTSLVRHLRPDWEYFDLERGADRDLILSDVDLFFQNHSKNLILDEAQLQSSILQQLRGVIDSDRSTYDRFIITGSSSPDLLKQASETLAGRVAIVELSPLKMNELNEEDLPPFYKLFQERLSDESLNFLSTLKPLRDNQVVYRSWLSGGYPEPCFRNSVEVTSLWLENYISTFVARDLKHLFPGIDSDTYRTFIAILRDFHGQEINIAEIARSLSVSEPTVRKYLDIAHHTFIWRKLSSYERTELRSVVKTPRGLFRDSGVFHHLIGVRTHNDLERSRYKGSSFEAFVIEEILRGLSCTSATGVSSSFYRTRGGAEVDLVIEGSFGVLPIEIKMSSASTIEDVRPLQRFIEQERLSLGIVVNLSRRVEYLSPKILQIPVSLI